MPRVVACAAAGTGLISVADAPDSPHVPAAPLHAAPNTVTALIHPGPRLLLLDFDGVLAAYARAARIAHLAVHCGCDPARVRQVLFASGLETAYDSGDIATADYLQRLGQGLGARVDEADWIAARVAGSRGDPAVIERVLALAGRIDIGVLTNNGALMAQAIAQIVPALFPLLHGRVLCSGALGGRKPQAEVYRRALDHFGVAPRHALFIDDLFVNVRGARALGMPAETASGARALRRALARHGLA
ncbi:HAD-IA family hydrolase [Xanthomonas hyacinthi]|uniref:Hydrolase n=1 Tax=Xanthomonas hyacinthi TaxID=56455 RepID=A0A2S7EZT8_9XANT|nr:hydrolase [Xanthomonas hyacinthi]QGY77520.1 HAD-IA family hydrolase [Xanthomonas hyacinthi]